MKRRSRRTRLYLLLPPDKVRDLMRAINSAEQPQKKIESIIDTEIGLSKACEKNIKRVINE